MVGCRVDSSITTGVVVKRKVEMNSEGGLGLVVVCGRVKGLDKGLGTVVWVGIGVSLAKYPGGASLIRPACVPARARAFVRPWSARSHENLNCRKPNANDIDRTTMAIIPALRRP